jgi:hypothetical protein
MSNEPIALDSIVCQSAQAVATEVSGEVVLLHLDRDRCHGLGVTGSDLWRRLRAPVAVADLLTQLEAEYHAEPGEIEADLLRALQEFAAEGLIHLCPPGN